MTLARVLLFSIKIIIAIGGIDYYCQWLIEEINGSSSYDDFS